MPSTKVFKPSFAGGEMSPEMFGRIDDAKYASGAALIQNLITTPLGPAERRPGFQYVNQTKGNGLPRLIAFTYSPTQTMVIECGAGYFRFYTMGEALMVGTQPAYSSTVNYNVGALVSSGGVNYYGLVASYGVPVTNTATWYPIPSALYEIPNPYLAADLMSLHWVQSNDVVTIVHQNYPPMELQRLGALQWVLSTEVFGQALPPPGGVTVTASPGYLAQIASILSDGLITTVSSHNLAVGDGVYIENLTAVIAGVPTVMDGFYLVSTVPVLEGGVLSPNELGVTDYSGNALDASSWAAWSPPVSPLPPATIQYGSKIFNITNFYVVTAVMSDGVQESAPSAAVSVLNNLDVTGSFNVISWTTVTGAYRYNVYKQFCGLYGFIGQTDGSSISIYGTSGGNTGGRGEPADRRGIITETSSFVDNNIAVDMSITPPNFIPVFNSAGNYPGAVSYYQQRKCFGGTASQPQNFWMTKSGTESDMSYSLPVLDTDRIAIAIAAREMSTIQHICPLLQLILLTSSCELSVSPVNTDVITPSTVDARPQSYIGASPVQPSIVNNSMIYCADRGGHVREMGYQWQIGGYVTGDISLRAGHLFDNMTIVDQAYMKAPWQIVWFVSSNGNLLGLTYIPEEGIGAWHHHVTAGSFQSIAVVAEGAEDRLYAVIQRTVNGAVVNYIERMSTRNYGTLPNCFYVDSGATYNGTNTTATTVCAIARNTIGYSDGTYQLTSSAAMFVYPAQTDVGSVVIMTGSDGNLYRFQVISTTSTITAVVLPTTPIHAWVTFPAMPGTAAWSWARLTITGLTWLIGQTVAILGDGSVQPQQVVSPTGTVTIQHPSVLVTVGLPYTPAAQTLPLVMQIDAQGQGRTKNINKVWIRLYQSSAIFAGPTPASLVQYKQRTTEPYGSPPNPVTDEIEITIPASWSTSGQVYIQQTDPLPLTLVGLTVEAVIGG
jgi:hypothetical protein